MSPAVQRLLQFVNDAPAAEYLRPCGSACGPAGVLTSPVPDCSAARGSRAAGCRQGMATCVCPSGARAARIRDPAAGGGARA